MRTLSSILQVLNIQKISVIFLVFGSISVSGYSQENPPIPIKVEVNTSQHLNFGAFTAGTTGGEVSISHDKIRTSNGDIVLLNFGSEFSPALFDITANPGTIITIDPAYSVLEGNNGGTLDLRIDSFSKGQIFITTESAHSVTPVFIGGTLIIKDPSTNPPGRYHGQVIINFIQQ